MPPKFTFELFALAIMVVAAVALTTLLVLGQ